MRTTTKAITLATLIALNSIAHADDASQSRIDLLEKQLQAMQAELAALKADQSKLTKTVSEQASTTTQLAEAVQNAPVKSAANDKLSVWGYAEVNYTRPTKDLDNTTADISRAVLGLGYRFNERTAFNSEFELEHAVTSSDDKGEFEIEQLYVDHALNDAVTLRSGLFLMPAGFLNRSHEPAQYFGVRRNFVETLIIPSTWREGGVSAFGTTESGISWQAGITTGLNLSEWKFNPEFPQFTTAQQLQESGAAPFQASHQEMSQANARRLATFAAVNYTGIPGVSAGASYFTGEAVPVAGVETMRTTLWDVHARWTPGPFDLSALYAHGSISHAAEANAQNPGTANPLPSAFYGYYLQAAWKAWEDGEQKLVPFFRSERFNLISSAEGLAPGSGVIPAGSVVVDESGKTGYWPRPYDTVNTLGVSYYLNANVVFKADMQQFSVNRDFKRFNLGLGLQF
ncbi:porin [Burkholderiaceae bacterium DAT-1]|nr:porin [Burkholderiaceae bacterium DAT-1]